MISQIHFFQAFALIMFALIMFALKDVPLNKYLCNKVIDLQSK